MWPPGLIISFTLGKQILAELVLLRVHGSKMSYNLIFSPFLTIVVVGNGGGLELPSRDRLIYLSACLIGHR